MRLSDGDLVMHDKGSLGDGYTGWPVEDWTIW